MAATYSAQGFGSGGPSPFVSQTAGVPAPAPAAAPQPAIWNPAASTALPTPAAPQAAPAAAGVHPPQTAQFDAPWGSALAGAFAGGQSTDAQSFMAKAAADAARAQVESLLVRWIPGMKTLWTTCKFYFAVDSKYVASKLALIAMPWTTKAWSRRWDTVPVDSSGNTASVPQTPAQDVHAPDLYIPSMAIVTFLLVVGLVKGVSMQFTPEALSEITTTCLITSTLETAIVYGAVYLTVSSTHVRGAGFVDLFALATYKYVGLVLALIASLVAGNLGFYAVLAYFAASTTWAMFNWLSAALNDAVPVAAAGRSKMVVFVACGLQVAVMLWLARH